MATQGWMASVRKQLGSKSKWYWTRVAVIGLCGIALNLYWTRHSPEDLLKFRMWAYQTVSGWNAREPASTETLIVSVDDDDFWKGARLNRRTPIKRDYLGDLIFQLCDAKAAVVALDFDFRSPVVDGSVKDNADYATETGFFINSVNKANDHCRIVLPTTLNCSVKPCSRESSVLDLPELQAPNVSRGYINLPEDTRQVPIKAELSDGTVVDSLAMAVVRVRDHKLAERLNSEEEFPYGTFMTDHQFRNTTDQLSSGEVLKLAQEHTLESVVERKTVLIGAGWHQYAYARGDPVDLHLSPLGMTPGVLLHFNYMAAALDNRFTRRVPEWVNIVADIALVLLVVIAFALEKPLIRWLVFFSTVALLFLVQYVAAQNAGIFFESAIVVILLFFHWLYDEHSKMREEIVELKALVKTSQSNNQDSR